MTECQTQNRVPYSGRPVSMTRYRLARLAGIRWQTLKDIESGRRAPRRGTMAKIRAAIERDNDRA